MPFVNQTAQLREYADHVISGLVPRNETLVAVWIGINDISDTAKWTNITSFPVFYDQLHDALFASLEDDLYALGYQNYLFVNLPPLDRTPGSTNDPSHLPNKTMVDWFDESLQSHVVDLQSSHEGVSATVFDANTFLNHVMDSPATYGILNTTGYCK